MQVQKSKAKDEQSDIMLLIFAVIAVMFVHLLSPYFAHYYTSNTHPCQ